ncbi:hypothetical protein ACIQ7Q_03890 [Streptomyces sp. NPDC096176]
MGHLDFLASLLVADDAVILTTMVASHHVPGRLCWSVVRHFPR